MADNLEEALLTADQDADQTIVIDSNLRTMKPKGDILLGVYNDTSVHTLSFEMPRYYDKIDLKDFQIRVNVENANGVRSAEEVTEVKNLYDRITFDWVLKRVLFEKAGIVRFNVCLKRFTSAGELTREFNTTVNRGIVLEGLEVDDVSKQAVLYRLRALRDKATSSVVIVGNTSFTYTQLDELVKYLEL